MTSARFLTVASACVALGATVAACSGSFGSGTGLPSTLASPSFGGQPSASSSPSSTSVILTYGDSTAFQPIPEIAGYTASIAFPKAPDPTKPPETAAKGKKDATPAPAPTPVSIAIGATLSVVKPADGPDLNFESGKGRKKRSREHPARALAFVTLLPTHDMTLESYPRIALDVPREVASQYRDGEFGLALWNSGEKDTKYRLAVAELDMVTTPPPVTRVTTAAPTPLKSGTAAPSASPSAAPVAATRGVLLPLPGASGAPGASPGAVLPSAAPTLPPERILFAGTATALKLLANRPAVFALYALPHPAAGTPAPSGSPRASTAASKASAAPAPASSPSAAASPLPTKAP